MAKTKIRRRPAVRFFAALMILLAVAIAALAAYIFIIEPAIVSAGAADEPETALSANTTFASGISVDGIALGGKTYSEAYAALAERERELTAEVHFILSTANSTYTLTHADVAIAFNTDELLREAIQLGNTGTKAEREAEQEALLQSPRTFTFTCTIDFTPAKPIMQALAADIAKEPVDAAVEMDMAVDGFFRYTDAVPGETLDEEALLARLNEMAENRVFGMVDLPILYTDAAITVDMLKETLTLRDRAETSFAKSPYNRDDRVYNVKKAAAFVNGTVLKPGDIFSTNDTLGPRTYELGWKPAPAYVSGTTEDQAGGGVCQVSSTLYAAVVKADLEIVYRRNHSSSVGYIAKGLDATINTGTIDFQFKNNTNSDIYIFAYTVDKSDGVIPEGKDDKTVHVEIYGEPFGDAYDTITLSAEKIETLAPSGEKEIIVDTTVAPDYYKEEVERRSGSVYQSYKHYYKDGVEIKKEPLAKSTYKAYAGKVVVGTGYYTGQTAAG